MKKILQIAQRFIRGCLDFAVRLILALAYFVILLPFAFFVRCFADFLETREASPFWHQRKRIEDVKDFLIRQ